MPIQTRLHLVKCQERISHVRMPCRRLCMSYLHDHTERCSYSCQRLSPSSFQICCNDWSCCGLVDNQVGSKLNEVLLVSFEILIQPLSIDLDHSRLQPRAAITRNMRVTVAKSCLWSTLAKWLKWQQVNRIYALKINRETKDCKHSRNGPYKWIWMTINTRL